VTGQSVTDLTVNGVANLGWDEVKLPHPLFEGDTVYSKSEVLETRPSRTRPDVGIVRVRTSGSNQAGQIVMVFTRTFMVWKRGHVPASGRPEEQ
jgi:itaconyl-CoA hydratase